MRRYGRSVAILLVLMVLGTAAGFYILLQQRLPNPFQHFYAVNADFSSAAAVVPGLGEPVNVAGVHVGEITGSSLKNGLGVIHMEIDPHKMPHLYQGAHADLVAEHAAEGHAGRTSSRATPGAAGCTTARRSRSARRRRRSIPTSCSAPSTATPGRGSRA